MSRIRYTVTAIIDLPEYQEEDELNEAAALLAISLYLTESSAGVPHPSADYDIDVTVEKS